MLHFKIYWVFSVWFLLLIRDIFSQNVHFEINCYFRLIFTTQCLGTATVNIKSLKYPQPSSQLKEHLPYSKEISRHIFSFFFSLFFDLFETLVLIIFNCSSVEPCTYKCFRPLVFLINYFPKYANQNLLIFR